MRKFFVSAIFGVFTFLSCGLMAAGYFAPSSVAVFNPTGRVNLTATATSASAVLASTSASSPIATTAVVHNLGAEAVFVELSASSNVVATLTGSYPVQAAQTAVLALKNARYAAVVAASGPVSVAIVTGN